MFSLHIFFIAHSYPDDLRKLEKWIKKIEYPWSDTAKKKWEKRGVTGELPKLHPILNEIKLYDVRIDEDGAQRFINDLSQFHGVGHLGKMNQRLNEKGTFIGYESEDIEEFIEMAKGILPFPLKKVKSTELTKDFQGHEIHDMYVYVLGSIDDKKTDEGLDKI